MRVFLGAATCLMLAAPAGAMTVAEFIAKGEPLLSKGMMALFSPDLKAVKAELKEVGDEWRAQAPSVRPPVCPPPPGKADMGVPFIRAAMAAVPPAERERTRARDAIIRALNERHRCR